MHIITDWTTDTRAFDPSAKACMFSVAGVIFTAHSRVAGHPVCLRHEGHYFNMGAWNRSDWAEKASAYLDEIGY